MTSTPKTLVNRYGDWTIKGIDYNLKPGDGCIWIHSGNGARVRIRQNDKGVLQVQTIDKFGTYGPSINL